ncbi:protein phosphatase 2C domain-containing protein [Streptomyces sp. NBC_00094]|uniref:protein phosphatase 2C domain-containing protein n=1 Tax=Streptomyces sp. NBC_00094 TaxID=2903620 RepID=UPI00224E3FE6|nr:protein phosphatase 2C domain-containing protein [Streptomyces sp. NBC_00094]MCX5393758.1 protein phosphatase 2C domain-containing protein [Streptomyces sp. NBC_00094]
MITAGAAVQGAAHLARGQGCQDAFKAVDLGEAAVLAVADGAGGRERSALGAHIAVDTACRILSESVPEATDAPETWTAWIAAAGAEVVLEFRRAVEGVLSATGRPSGRPTAPFGPADPPPPVDAGALAATLVAAVVRPPWVAFLSVGDCFGTVLTREPAGTGTAPQRRERCHLVLPPPPPGAPETVFLSSPGAGLRLRSFVVWEPQLSGVVLATDGCAALTLDHPSVRELPPEAGPLPSERFFCGLAATLRANGGDAAPLRDLLSGPEAARTGDDLTVLCALTDGR